MKKTLSLILALLLVLTVFFGCSELPEELLYSDSTTGISETTGESLPLDETDPLPEAPTEALPDPDGSYTTKEDVALYIHVYGELPSNFITKKEARNLGWSGGGLDGYADGKCIGGDRFGNYEGLLPDADGRSWTECDIDTLHADSRGPKRIVFSNDGLIYYTGDHYESFELLYGEP
ncbi:MAG: ribonuclease [Oscillospiraceae bacterium]|nr:ribonuclease [Oscillospiraceae bacterium]